MKITVKNVDGRLGTGVASLSYTTQRDGGVTETVNAASPVKPEVKKTSPAKKKPAVKTAVKTAGKTAAKPAQPAVSPDYAALADIPVPTPAPVKQAVKKQPSVVRKNASKAVPEKQQGTVRQTRTQQRPKSAVQDDYASLKELARAYYIPGTSRTSRQTPGFESRLVDTLSGAGKTYGGSLAGFGGLSAELLEALDRNAAQSSPSGQRARQEAENIRRYQAMLDNNMWANGVPLTAEDREKIAGYIQSAQRFIDTEQARQENVHAPIRKAADSAYGAAARLTESGQRDIDRAKDGLNGLGRFAVDVGVAGAQMGLDFAPSILTGGGSALVPMFFRSAGGGALAGKDSGADLATRTAYALGSGALSVATEQISNIAGPFRKLFGAGAADRIAARLVERFGENGAVQVMNRLSQTAAGQTALAAFGEGAEEFIEGLGQAFLQEATITPTDDAPPDMVRYAKNSMARFDPVEAGYEFLIGAALGGLGGGVDVLRRGGVQESGGNQTESGPEPPGTPPGGVDTPAAPSASERITDPLAEAIRRGGRLSDTPVDMQKEFERFIIRKDGAEAAPKAEADLLSSLLPQGKRVSLQDLSAGQLSAVEAANTWGTVDVDAKQQAYQVNPEEHIDRRKSYDMGRKSVNAFQFDHPQLHEFYKGAAEALLNDLAQTQKGGELIRAEGDYYGGRRLSRFTSPAIEALLDEYRLSYGQIEKALNAIIQDKGQENYAAAKRVELVLDDMLSNGFKDVEGRPYGPDEAYLAAKAEIAGSLEAETEAAPQPDLGVMGQEIQRHFGKKDSGPEAAPQSFLMDFAELHRRILEAQNKGEKQQKTAPITETEVNENGLKSFSSQEQENLSSGKKNKIVTTFDAAVEFVRSMLKNKQSVDRAYLGKIPDAVVDLVLQETGIDIRGFSAMINGDDIRHIIKNHGDPLMESARGQIAVTSEDIARIPEILSAPDRVSLSESLDGKGRTVIIFEKNIRDRLITMQGVAKGKNLLQTDTIYIQKGRTRTTRDTMPSAESAAPVINARSEPPLSSSDVNITESASDVNPADPQTDGLGAADAGSVNSDYDRLQAQSSEFHDPGPDPARHVDVPKKDFAGRDISKSASTVMGAEAIPDSVIPMIEQMTADGTLSYDRVSNAASLERARNRIETDGFDAALESFRNDVRSGIVSKDLETLGQLLLVNAANAGDGNATAEILSLYVASGTNAAQAMQARSILRQLSPESQLYSVRKSVEQINRANERRSRPVKGVSAEDALAAYQSVVDTMREAFAEMERGQNGAENAPGWVEQLGKDLARNAARRVEGSRTRPASFYSTLLGDLNALMAQHVDAKKGTAARRTAADRIADIFANREEYIRAWNSAKAELAERYRNNPAALEALEDFMYAGLNYNGAGPDTVMMRAAAEAALENDVGIRDIVIRGTYDMDALAEQISNTLIANTNASGPDAVIVRDAVRRYIQNKKEASRRSAEQYIHTDIQKTIREIGTSMAAIIRSGAQSKAEVQDKITAALIQQYGVSQEAAPGIAEAIAQDFENMVWERSRARLDSMFKDRPTRTRRTLSEKFEELVNLGAFSGNEFSQRAVKKLFGIDAGAEISPELIQKFLDQTDQEGREKVMEDIVKDIASQLPSNFRAKFDCIRYLCMLGNPRTHIRNILGNTFFQIPVAVKNRTAAAIEAGYNLLSGGKLERSKSLSGVNPASQLAKECRADWVNAEAVLGTDSKYSSGQTALRGIEKEVNPFQHSGRVLKGIGELSALNGKALSAEDTAAKKWIYGQSLAGYLKANGVKSISEASPQLLSRARNYAAQEAMRNTFNDRNMVSDAISQLGGWYHSENPFKIAVGSVLEGNLPFKRTTANIAVRAVEYSPVGIVGSIADAVYRGVTGTETAESVTRRIDRLAAGLSGTVLMAAGALLSGCFSGGGDEDERQQAFNDLTGHQSYALELENGTSATLDWLAPEAIPFFMGVELGHACQDGGVSWEEFWQIIKNMKAPMLEMSVLQGLNDVFEDASYAQRTGGDYITAFVLASLSNYFTQVIPTAAGQLERSTESRRMSTYADENSAVPKDLQFFLGKVSKKVPGWDYGQIPYIDEWGREESSGGPVERVFNNFFNPAYMSRISVDNMEKELQRLADATGETSVFPSRVDKSFMVGGEMKYLTAEEYTRYARTVGKTRYDILSSLFQHEGYGKLSDEDKARTIAAVYEYANAVGKMEVSSYRPEGAVLELFNSPLDPATFFLYKRMMAIEDAKQQGGAQANANVREALYKDSTLNPQEKNLLDDLIIHDMTIIPRDKDVDYSNQDSFAVSQMSDSAVRRWENVHAAFPDLSGEDYRTAWEICQRRGTTASPYTQERKQRDLMEALGLSQRDAWRLMQAVKG